MIDREHDLAVKRQAELLSSSRGSVYYLPKPTSEGDRLRGTIRYPGQAFSRQETASCCEPNDHWHAVCGRSACTV